MLGINSTRQNRATYTGVIVVLGMFLILSVGVIAGQNVGASINDCQSINSSGEYVLEGDITVQDGNETCIEIKSSNVTFDGKGNNITGIRGQNSTGISVSGGSEAVDNVTVTNVSVVNWGDGISLTAVNESTVKKSTIESTEEGIVLGGFTPTSRNVVKNNSIRSVNGSGVSMVFAASKNTVKNNEIKNNNGTATLIFFGPENNTVSDNIMKGNQGGYLSSLAANTTVSNNEVVENEFGVGTALSFGEAIKENRIETNSLGILFDNSSSTATENELRGNGIDYLDRSGGGGTTTDSQASVGTEAVYGFESGVLDANTDVLNTDSAGQAQATDVTGMQLEKSQTEVTNTVENTSFGTDSNDTVLSFESQNVSVDGVDPKKAPSPPEKRKSLGLYFNATNDIQLDIEGEDGLDEVLEDPTLDVDVHYNDKDIHGAYEPSLRLWRYDRSSQEWEETDSGVDTQGNLVNAELSSFSTFGVFEDIVYATVENESTDSWNVTNQTEEIADVGTENPTITVESGQRYEFKNEGWSDHPFEIRDENGSVLLSQSDKGEFEDDSQVGWKDNGVNFSFTVTEELAGRLDTYVSTENESSMSGEIVGSLFVEELKIAGAQGPPQNIPKEEGGLDDELTEDLDGDGDPTDTGPTVVSFGKLLRGDSLQDSGFSDEQARALNWNPFSPETEVRASDMVNLFGKQLRAD